MLILGRRHVEAVLGEYVKSTTGTIHTGPLASRLPSNADTTPAPTCEAHSAHLQRTDVLGGLIDGYRMVASPGRMAFRHPQVTDSRKSNRRRRTGRRATKRGSRSDVAASPTRPGCGASPRRLLAQILERLAGYCAAINVERVIPFSRRFSFRGHQVLSERASDRRASACVMQRMRRTALHTPARPKERCRDVPDAEQVVTRERRIRRTQKELGEGQRRPCCWPGCKHRERSRGERSTGSRAARGDNGYPARC